MSGYKRYDLRSIEEAAAQLHDKYVENGEGLITVEQLNRLAEELGASVEAVDFSPDDVAARVFENGRESGTFTIQISRGDPARRQKFSLAHEIAHIILHNINETPLVEYRKPILDYADPTLLYKETQANAFAAALLIPQAQARDVWLHVDDIDDFAELFEVSRSAAYNRLSNLGLLEN